MNRQMPHFILNIISDFRMHLCWAWRIWNHFYFGLNLQWNAVTELLWLMRKTTENLTKLRTLMFHDALMTLTLYPNRRSAKLEVWQNACVFLFTWREHGKEQEQIQKSMRRQVKKAQAFEENTVFLLRICERSYSKVDFVVTRDGQVSLLLRLQCQLGKPPTCNMALKILWYLMYWKYL